MLASIDVGERDKQEDVVGIPLVGALLHGSHPIRGFRFSARLHVRAWDLDVTPDSLEHAALSL